MRGIMIFDPPRHFVGKKKQYNTKEDFAKGVKEEFEKDIEISNVFDGYVRYYPKGTQDSEFEFGKGEGVYQFIDKPGKGNFQVWAVESEE